MSEIVGHYLWLIPCLPLAAATLIAFLGPRLLKNHSHWLCVLAIAGACVFSVLSFLVVYNAGHEAHEGEHAGHAEHAQPFAVVKYYEWISVGEPGKTESVSIGLSLRADALSMMMAVMVTFIGTFIAIYAVGYMHGEKGYPRFFAAVSLFVFSMLLLVLGDNLVVLYAGWEGVGLCSYLLIGYWFTKPSAADAARKAFLVTRIGDVGLLVGIILLWFNCDYKLDYATIFEKAPHLLDMGLITPICLLLFMGCVGKSAQFPLHVWLPDAMEGPTPVSALIHAATMVTAGVYLVARCTPLFVLSPAAQVVVAGLGGTTMLLAALIALTQNDLKRVLAYSTLSQLGYMFLSLGCALDASTSIRGLATFAVIAAMFHLLTHAFFKALLFLSAGSVMHAMGGVIDMRRFSGLRKVLPYTHWTFLCGAVALAGLPFFSGFWSKDEILSAAYDASTHATHYKSTYLLLFLAGMLTAGLTAFYTFRAYFMTFWGDLKVPPEAGAHGSHDDEAHDAHGHGHAPKPAHAAAHGHGPGVAHESPPVMTVPLMVLAVFAVGVGGALGPTHLFAHFLEKTPGFPAVAAETMNVPLMVTSSLLAAGGLAVAWLMYMKQPAMPAVLAKRFQGLYQLSLNKFYIDELYVAFLVNPVVWLYGAVRALDQYLIDGLVDLIGQVPRMIGYLFRPVQNGLVQFYALAMVLGLTVFLLALIRSL